MIPDIQRVVTDFLRDNGLRAVTKPPTSTTTAWVMVTEINAPQEPNSAADTIVNFGVQLDCYAGQDATGETPHGAHGAPEANDLCREVRALLPALSDSDLDDTQVSAVRITNQFPQPDQSFKPARDRWILDTTITARSLEPAS